MNRSCLNEYEPFMKLVDFPWVSLSMSEAEAMTPGLGAAMTPGLAAMTPGENQ